MITKFVKYFLFLNIIFVPVTSCHVVKVAIDILQVCELLKICGNEKPNNNTLDSTQNSENVVTRPTTEVVRNESSNSNQYVENVVVTPTPEVAKDETNTNINSNLDFSGNWCVKISWKTGFYYEGTLNLTKDSSHLYSGKMQLNSTYDPQNISHSVTQDISIIVHENTFDLIGSNAIATSSRGDSLRYEPDNFTLNIYENISSFEGNGTDSKNDIGSIRMNKCS